MQIKLLSKSFFVHPKFGIITLVKWVIRWKITSLIIIIEQITNEGKSDKCHKILSNGY